MQPRPAATVLLLRDGPRAVEVLLLERRLDSGFVPGAHVFPGGAVDPADHDADVHAHTDGPGEVSTPAGGDDPSGDLAHRVAAVRETFEEAGVLLARHAHGRPARGDAVAALQPQREALEAGALTIPDLCATHDLTLATAALRPFAHWVTPTGAPRRYDTRFFLAAAPEGQAATPCGREATRATWMTPTEALERQAAGDLLLILPTERCLHALAGFERTADVLSAADRALAAPSPWIDDRGGRRLAIRSPRRGDAEEPAA